MTTQSAKRLLPLTLLFSLSLGGLVGCNQLAQLGIGTTPISQVTANPSQYPDVTVRGRVVNQIGVLGRGAYELKDDSGSLWVLTQAGMPATNATVVVRGGATEGVAIANQRLGVTITEKERF